MIIKYATPFSSIKPDLLNDSLSIDVYISIMEVPSNKETGKNPHKKIKLDKNKITTHEEEETVIIEPHSLKTLAYLKAYHNWPRPKKVMDPAGEVAVKDICECGCTTNSRPHFRRRY